VRIPLPLLLAAACAPGCASSDGEARGTGWGGIREERPEPPPPLKGALSVPTPSVAPYPVREFTAEERALFDRAWSAFKAADPRWPALKGEWIAAGPEATGVLAENLYRAMVAARARGALHLAEQARKELVLMGDGAVPVLVGGLAVRAVRTPEGEEIRLGQEVLHEAASALSLVGAPAVPGLLDIAGSGERNLVVEAAWALGNIVDPRAEGLLLRLSRDPAWEVRSAAVLALRGYPTAAARDRMVEALEDPEELVVQRGAQALVSGRHVGELPRVVDVLERGVPAGEILRVRACVFVLRSLTGERIEADPAAWRAALGRGR
jgi:hypothetical protein